MKLRALFLFCGAVLAATGVVVGAAASHALKADLPPEALRLIATGERYQMWHALALIAVGCLPFETGRRWLTAAGLCLLVGTVLFSGSLYTLALTSYAFVGPVTPVGGTLMILGWVCFAGHALVLLRCHNNA